MPSLLMPIPPSNSTEPTSSSATIPAIDMTMFSIPLPVDIALHLLPTVALSIHFFVTEYKYSRRQARVWAPLTAIGVAVWYASFAEWCASVNGTFSYPFLNVPFPARLGIYIAVTAIALGIFTLLNKLHSGAPLVPSVYAIDPRKKIATQSKTK